MSLLLRAVPLQLLDQIQTKVHAITTKKRVDRDGKIERMFKDSAMSNTQQEKAWARFTTVIESHAGGATDAECEVIATPPPPPPCVTRRPLSTLHTSVSRVPRACLCVCVCVLM